MLNMLFRGTLFLSYACACAQPLSMGKLNCFTNEFIHRRRRRQHRRTSSFHENHHNTFISSNILMCLLRKWENWEWDGAETASTQTNFKRIKMVGVEVMLLVTFIQSYKRRERVRERAWNCWCYSRAIFHCTDDIYSISHKSIVIK